MAFIEKKVVLGFQVAVVIIWIGLLGYYLSRFPEPTFVTPHFPSFKPATDQWFGVYMSGSKIGYLHRQINATSSGHSLLEEGLLRLRLGDSLQRVTLNTVASLSDHFELERFDFAFESQIIQMKVMGLVSGRFLLLETETNGRREKVSLPLTAPIYLPSMLEAAFAGEGREPGQRVMVSLFDPMTLSQEKMEIEVVGIEPMKTGSATEPILKLKGRFKELVVYSWVTSQGRVLREESPGGMVLLAQTEKEALSFRETEPVPDLLSVAAASSSQVLPNPRRIQRLAYRLEGWKDSTITGRVHQNAVPAATQIQSYRLPHPITPDLKAFLVPERFVESDHPKIKSATEGVLGGEKDAWNATGRLANWVYENLEKHYTVSIPDALTVLELKAGDCNEHTVLFTAMARAAGIPTRMAAGVVYLNDRFYYHAWPEVWLGQWVAVDPTFDQFPADATHIRLVTGGLDQQISLVEAIGQLKVEVVSFQ
jgi:transglutaminase-like putative cysteine protease